jgi:isoquinoline 1-oxidoreductase beta subunit
LENGVDSMSVHGAIDMPYDVPNTRFESYNQTYPVPVLWYRGTGRSHTVFAVETFVDRLAGSGGLDPLNFRRRLIDKQPRLLHVMELAAEKADWGSPMKDGRARGIAIHASRGTQIAQVAEITVLDDGGFSVDRVVTAVDVGIALNPDNIRSQVEGGTGFGLSSALGDEITLRNGLVEQTNFDRYPVLRIGQMPAMETHIVDSTESPTGIGDFTPLVIGPAVANALFAATGHPVGKLPIQLPP